MTDQHAAHTPATPLSFPKQTKSFPLSSTLSIGGDDIILFAGPCSIESYEQLSQVARALVDNNVHVLRGGSFKARTHHDSFQGLGYEALEIMQAVGKEFGLITVTEVLSELDVAQVADHVDVLQIGARNSQNYRLISAVGEVGKPVIIKRGMGETLEELVASTEYLLSTGNDKIILCERGIRTFETSLRATFDVSSIPVLQELCQFPVIADPSHAAGEARYVAPLAQAAVAAGADGIMVEVHPDPATALSDAKQQLNLTEFSQLTDRLRKIAELSARGLR